MTGQGRRRRGLLLALGALLLGAAVADTRDPEERALTGATRRLAPGEFVYLPDGATHYEIAGPDTGRPVLLVHGMSVPLYIWDSTVTALTAAGFRTIRLDLYGRGWSDRPDLPYDGDLTDRQLKGLLDSLGLPGPVDIIGVSYGGFVTGHFARSYPRRVRSLTLIDPVFASRPMPARYGLPLLGPWLWQVTEVPRMAAGQPTDFLHPEAFPDWEERYRTQQRYEGFGRAILRTRQQLAQTDLPALYRAVGATGRPVLLLWGREDRVTPFEGSAVVRAAIPAAEFFPVDSAAHLPMLERSAPVHARIVDFLRAH
jgi:pimeloyl-ACP methyl ester carboxylesterase